MLRSPAVSGRFYPQDPEELKIEIDSFCAHSRIEEPHHAIACIVPHAGYRYSGHVAGAVYGQLEIPRKCLIIGPRHRPRGQPQAVISEGAWQTPLGNARIDTELAHELVRACSTISEDELAHREEHSIEVQLPFLQFLSADLRFVPLVLGPVAFDVLQEMGRAIAATLADKTEPVLLVASSDMNHYESDEITRRKDSLALDRILAIDARGLYDVVRRAEISMCGVGPVVSVLIAAKLLGATSASLVRYATSGDVSGDRSEVVGYAGLIIE